MKCGEERPVCLRCVKSSFICDGYALDGPLQKPSQTSVTSMKYRPLLPNDKSASRIIKNPCPSLCKDEKEGRYFDNFCSQTSYEILPSFNSGVLRRMPLQAVQEEPSIRYALVGLGALDAEDKAKRDRGSIDLPGAKLSLSRYQLDALEQYTIALRLMQVKLLISCVRLRLTSSSMQFQVADKM